MKASKLFPLFFLVLALVLTACNDDQDQTTNEGQNTEENNNEDTASQDDTKNEDTEKATEGEENSSENENAVPQEGTESPENEVFKISSPQLGAHVGKTFTVEGQAQVFEGQFSYRIEDENGNELTSDQVTVEAGGDEGESLWRHFQFQVAIQNQEAVEGNLILFTTSQKDGSAENELIIPLTFTKNES